MCGHGALYAGDAGDEPDETKTVKKTGKIETAASTNGEKRCMNKTKCHCSRTDPFIVNYEFTAEQIVHSPGASFPGDTKKGVKPCDCEKNDDVAHRGPHTGTQTGTFFKDLHLGGVPVTLGSPGGKK